MNTPTPSRHVVVTAFVGRTTAPRAIVTMGALIPSLLLGACKPVEPAPADVDEMLLRWWDAFHGDDVEALTLLADQSWDIVEGKELRDDGERGRQSRLSAAQQDMVTLEPPPDDDGSWTKPDIALAAPIYLLKRYTCDTDQLARILSEEDQLSLYDDYETYSRDYTVSTVEDFRAGSSDELAWTVELSANYAGLIKYSQVLRGRMLRVPLSDDGPWTGDHFLITRTYIPWPADFEADANEFIQDYQLEVYLPLDGDIVHLYPVWRQNQLLGQSLEGEGLANIMLGGLSDWDDTTEEHCAAGRP